MDARARCGRRLAKWERIQGLRPCTAPGPNFEVSGPPPKPAALIYQKVSATGARPEYVSSRQKVTTLIFSLTM